MLQEFLDRLAGLTGKRYTKADFGKMVNEATKEADKAEKEAAKDSDKKK
jgi:hypothetical protein